MGDTASRSPWNWSPSIARNVSGHSRKAFSTCLIGWFVRKTDAFLNEQLELERSTGGPDPDWLDKALMDRSKAATPGWLEEATRMERAIAYHAAMQRKYEDAARRPWLPVEPDPPPPELKRLIHHSDVALSVNRTVFQRRTPLNTL